jgi:arsenite-transporting ATPase
VSSLFGLRTLLVTGKGGVGKTTISAALARAAAEKGKRVLCAELAYDADSSSPLAEALGASRSSDEPIEIAHNIRSVLLTPSMGHHHFLRDALPMRVLADAAMKSSAIRRFLLAAPTFAEMGMLYRLQDLLRIRRWDGSFEHETVIVDLPATGHALALAQVPSAILKIIPGGPLRNAMKEALRVLVDDKTTGAIVVTLPETLPVSEAIELARGLAEYNVPIARIVMNRFPHDPFEPAERSIAEEMARTYDPILGARSLSRIARAAAANVRLGNDLPAPLLMIGDVWAEGARVSETVAEAFAKQESP